MKIQQQNEKQQMKNNNNKMKINITKISRGSLKQVPLLRVFDYLMIIYDYYDYFIIILWLFYDYFMIINDYLLFIIIY